MRYPTGSNYTPAIMTDISKVVSWLSDPALKTSESVPRSNHSTNSKTANTRRVLFNDLKRDAISLADAPQLLYHPVDLLISAECTVEISQSVIVELKRTGLAISYPKTHKFACR